MAMEDEFGNGARGCWAVRAAAPPACAVWGREKRAEPGKHRRASPGSKANPRDPGKPHRASPGGKANTAGPALGAG